MKLPYFWQKLTALAGIFGMNLPSGLERGPAWGFWDVLGCGILLGISLSCWVVRAAPTEPRRVASTPLAATSSAGIPHFGIPRDGDYVKSISAMKGFSK